MNLETRRLAIGDLSFLANLMGKMKITNRELFRRFAKESGETFALAFGYVQKPGMPPIHSLVNVDFHPTLPLVMFNYSPVAHNTLHSYPDGWTPALRMCRGIVFELFTGRLIAHPFPKFFNLGEHPETVLQTLIEKLKASGDSPHGWYATEKMDGHLGIIFEYEGKIHFTTRGSFGSPSALLGTKVLRRYEKEFGWKANYPSDMTTLVEFIDPATKVHVDYGAKSGFTLLGAYNRETLVDASWSLGFVQCAHDQMDWLPNLGGLLHLEMTKLYQYESHGFGSEKLLRLVSSLKNRDIVNAEGFVIRLPDGTRAKGTYIGLIAQKKLSPTYLMNRIMAGNLDKTLNTLDKEVVSKAHEMLGRILRVQFMEDNMKIRRQYLYSIVPPESSTAYYRNVCYKFLIHLMAFWAGPVAVPEKKKKDLNR